MSGMDQPRLPARENLGRRVAVIGAGVAGLVAAARLAHAGCAVTLIEAAARPGGRMRTLDSAAGPVDAGPTVLTLRGVFDELFAAAGRSLDDHVRLTPLPQIARHWWPDGTRLDLVTDTEANAAAICAAFGPRAETAFRTFDAAAAAAFAAFEAPVMRAPCIALPRVAAAALRTPAAWPLLAPGRTLSGYLDRIFAEPKLRQLFGRYATYVGGLPAEVPALLALVWRAETAGVWAVAGGMGRLAAALADLAEAGGARLRSGVVAERILVHWGRVAGVGLADGSSVAADAVVFAGDPAALAQGLLGRAAQAAVAAGPLRRRSLSARVWAFAAQAGGADLAHHTVLFTDDPAAEFGPLAAGRAPEAGTIYLCAQDRGAGPAPAGPERFEAIQNAPPIPQGAPPPPPSEDERCHAMFLQTLDRFGLALSPAPPIAAMTGPRDWARMHPGSAGSIYGSSPAGMLAAFRRPTAATPLPGLWLAGGGVHPGPGVPMAARSGLNAAAAILAAPPSPSRSGRTAMPGGMSTASRTTAGAPSRSSDS
jgi:1-hydroxycarotenoid 3,4-desaturase